ncbi:hypothetical protein, partial [Sinorhizobium meliloti]|uniref:hypothetical protein n=1 Tax=Rhizobium meliloti TaxID=382 RepID=UPI002285C31F
MRILRRACAAGNLFGAPNLSAGALFRLLLVAFLVAFSSVALAQESGAQPEAGAATGAEGASQADAAPALPPQAFPEEQARIDAWRGDCQEFCAVGHDDEKERIITWLSRKNFWTSSWL